jgi:hypothetical protein
MSLRYAIPRLAIRTLKSPAGLTRSVRCMGSVSAIDSGVFRSLFGTDEIRKVGRTFSPKHLLWDLQSD